MTEIPAGAVTIADLYRELAGLRGDLQQALTSLKVIEVRDDATARQLGDHEMRLRLVEAFRWKIAGMAVTVSVAISALGTWIEYALIHH